MLVFFAQWLNQLYSDFMCAIDLPTHLTPEMIEEFHAKGYLKVKGLISPDQVEDLKVDYERAVRGEITVPQFEGRKKEGPVVQLACPSQHIPGWQEHPYFRKALAIARQLMGDDQAYAYDQIIFKPPHSNSPTAWHQDAAYWGGDKADGKQAITCWLALGPTFLENGCMQFVPGSHLGPLQPHYSIAGLSEINEALATDVDSALAVPCPLESGDASFHHSKTLHCTGGNISDVARYGLITHYSP